MFGEEVEEVDDKEEKVPETTVAPSTELPKSIVETTQVSSTTEPTQGSTSFETTQSPSTTETLKETFRVLEQPEELTTLAPESSTFTATTSEAATTSQVSTTTSAAETTMANEAVTIREVPTETSTSITQEPTTQEPTTSPTTAQSSVLPTEFDKLLTTLREFVAKVDSVASTEASSTISGEAAKVEQQVEFVNFTVSSEKHEEAAKSISKRSIDDADLIPRYFKHQSSKDKVCVYNGRNFKVGEVIQTDNECLKCLCEYAPIGHCVLKDKCNL